MNGDDKMAQLDSYLKRIYSEYEISYLEDYFDLYDFTPNEDLRKILAAFHTNINKWFLFKMAFCIRS